MKETLAFLKKLEKNNNRDWFADHKTEYQKLHSGFKEKVEQLFQKMKIHDKVDDFKVFRIYRDVRFSKNKLPYKSNFSVSFHREKPQLRGGYYIDIQPNNQSFLGVGFWNPNKEDLMRIRKEFEMDDEEFRDLLNDKTFKSVWGNLEGDELKTAPRDFDKDHKAIDLIRKKQYIFTKSYTDKEVCEPNFVETVNENFKTIRPIFNYFSDVLTTNLNGESLV